MTSNKRTKATSAYRESLRFSRRRDYERLVKAAVTALVEDEENIFVAFPHILDFPPSFPKGTLSYKEGNSNIRKISASKLLVWLREEGYTSLTEIQVGCMKAQVTRQANEIDNLFEIF